MRKGSFSRLSGKGLIRLWKEYEDRKTPEAKYPFQLDKLEIAIQARIYSKDNLRTADIFSHVDDMIDNPRLKRLLKEMKG